MRTLALAALALFASVTLADIGVMTIEGKAITGSLGSIPFNDAHVAFTAAYDTEQIVHFDDTRLCYGHKVLAEFWTAPIIYATVDIDGVLQADITVDGEVGSYSSNCEMSIPPSEVAIAFPCLFCREPYFGIEGGLVDPFADYDLTYTYGPVRLGWAIWWGYSLFRIETSAGELVIDPRYEYPGVRTAYVEVTPAARRRQASSLEGEHLSEPRPGDRPR